MHEHKKIVGYVTYNLNYTFRNLDNAVYNINSYPIVSGPGY